MTQNPNLVVFLPDQFSITALGCYGNEGIETPNINGIASDGVRFDNAYCTQPVCTPSRSAIMTGQYPHTTGLTENDTPLPDDARCLPELGDFDEYATAYMGKWDLGDEIFAQHGFDEWVAFEDGYYDQYTRGPESARSDYHEFLIEQGYDPDWERDIFSRHFTVDLPEEHTKTAYIADRAIEFVENHQDQPFILFVAPLPPHSPYFGPRDDQYDPADVPLPPNQDHDGTDEQSLRHRVRRWADSRDRTADDWRELISKYWGLASLVDTHVGRVLDTIEACGLSDETITAFTSDHGDMTGHQGMMAKQVMFEQSVRVPLIVDLPGDPSGRTIEHPVSQIDFLPTLLDAMGRPTPGHLQGHSLLPFVRGETDQPACPNVVIEWNGPTFSGYRKDEWPDDGSRPPSPDEYFEEAPPFDEAAVRRANVEPIRTVITPDRRKLNYYRDGERELYDLEADPNETENLAAQDGYADTVEELAGKLFDWQVRTRDVVYMP